MKTSITKINTKSGRKFNNHNVSIDGLGIGVVGFPTICSKKLTFISKSEESDKFDGMVFTSVKAAKSFFSNI